jgi:endoglucanase
MKKIISFILSACFLFPAAGITYAAEPKPFTPVTGHEMMKRLDLGMNLFGYFSFWQEWAPNLSGLALEMPGREKASPELFEALAAKGFDFVRFQIHWMPHLDKDYNIDKAWLDRIQEVTDWALDAGLHVILNTYAGPDEKDEGELSYDEIKPYLLAVWKQVAERFKDYSEYVIFDVMNEPHGEDWDIGAHTASVVNKLNADALSLIRKSGGFNDKRIVLLPTAGASADRMALERYVFPDDKYCMASVHAYTPWWFSLGEEAGDYKSRSGRHDVFSKEAEQEIHHMYKRLQSFLTDKKIPFLMGETGAVDKDNINERVKWASVYFKEAGKIGMPTCLHSDLNDYEQINNFSMEWKYPDFINAIFTAYGKEPGDDYIRNITDTVLFEADVSKVKPGNDNSGWRYFETWDGTLNRQRVALSNTVIIECKTDVLTTWGSSFGISYSHYHDGGKWTMYEYPSSPRITVDGNQIIFDTTGLTPAEQIGMDFWNTKDWEKSLSRFYLEARS